MDSRERVVSALNHQAPDQVPVDFGGTLCSGIHVSCVAELRQYYGLEKRPVKVFEPFQMLGAIDDDLKEALGVDVEAVAPRKNFFGFENKDWKEYRLDSGQTVLVPGDFQTTKDKNGDTYIFPGGDRTATPSGHMPQNGYYFDGIIRCREVDDEKLRVEDNLEEFGIMAEADICNFRADAEAARKTGRAVLANIGGMGLGDVALVPGPALKEPKGIRDIEEWYISTLTRQDYLHELFRRQTDIALVNLDRVNRAAGKLIDVLFVCGADFGTQTSTLCSAETFRELYLPYYQKMNHWIHQNTPWKTFKHCCGAVADFMPLFIEAGFDIINPVQCSAAGMEPHGLKKRFGGRLTFWGGGVDTQMVLPFGTPAQVREQVLERCEIFSRQGGFVFNTIHNIQAKTPVENIAAMVEAVGEFNRNGMLS